MKISIKYTKTFAIVALFLVTLVMLSTSLFITPTTISDSDPSTYVIVPILMLPFLVLLTMKNKPEPNVQKKDIVVGVLAFAAFIIATVFLRIYFSFNFIGFRIDMLLFPLAFFACVSLIFGLRNIGKFKAIMLYSLLASPAILYPLISASGAFTQLNSLAVYEVVMLFVPAVTYAAPITINANGYAIGIGQSCVSLGIFIALALFLIPVAYFYEGKLKNKILWLASGIVLLLVLNLIRMIGISFIWLAYGPDQTALLIHNLIGVALFYAVIVIMILVSRFYGLGTNMMKKKEARRRSKQKGCVCVILVALAFSLIYLFLTLNYSSALKISPASLITKTSFDFNNIQISRTIAGILNKGNFTSFVSSNEKGDYAVFSLSNSTINATSPLVLLTTVPNKQITDTIEHNNTLIGKMLFFNSKGITEQVLDVSSNSTEFLVYNTNMPMVLANSSSVIAGLYVIIPREQLANVTSCSSYDIVYSVLPNIANPALYNQTVRQNMIAAECMANKILWS